MRSVTQKALVHLLIHYKYHQNSIEKFCHLFTHKSASWLQTTTNYNYHLIYRLCSYYVNEIFSINFHFVIFRCETQNSFWWQHVRKDYFLFKQKPVLCKLFLLHYIKFISYLSYFKKIVLNSLILLDTKCCRTETLTWASESDRFLIHFKLAFFKYSFLSNYSYFSSFFKIILIFFHTLNPK